jgi:hypothetical protein
MVCMSDVEPIYAFSKPQLFYSWASISLLSGAQCPLQVCLKEVSKYGAHGLMSPKRLANL